MTEAGSQIPQQEQQNIIPDLPAVLPEYTNDFPKMRIVRTSNSIYDIHTELLAKVKEGEPFFKEADTILLNEGQTGYLREELFNLDHPLSMYQFMFQVEMPKEKYNTSEEVPDKQKERKEIYALFPNSYLKEDTELSVAVKAAITKEIIEEIKTEFMSLKTETQLKERRLSKGKEISPESEKRLKAAEDFLRRQYNAAANLFGDINYDENGKEIREEIKSGENKKRDNSFITHKAYREEWANMQVDMKENFPLLIDMPSKFTHQVDVI